MELALPAGWPLWTAALALAIAGQVLALSGDGIARLMPAYLAVAIGLLGALYAASGLDPLTMLGVSALVGTTAAILARNAIAIDHRGAAALFVATTGMAFVSTFTTTVIRGATGLP